MGTHRRILSQSYPMNINMFSSDGFQKSLCPCALDENILSVRRVKDTRGILHCGLIGGINIASNTPVCLLIRWHLTTGLAPIVVETTLSPPPPPLPPQGRNTCTPFKPKKTSQLEKPCPLQTNNRARKWGLCPPMR